MQAETRQCQNCKKDFTIEPDDFGFYEKIKVPPPTFCPKCRMIRRFNFRNEGMLFRRVDAHDGKEIFSGFSPDASVLTYENNYWYGTNWDPNKTGVDYDFFRPFFEQYKELLSRAPIPSRSVLNLVNSDYCNEAGESKNSYLCFNTDFVENCAYLRKVTYIKDSFDLYECKKNELCYENVMVDKSYKVFFSLDCESCVDVWFSRGLKGCTNCFGCVNLVNKSNYFFNEQLTKEDYDKKFKEFISASYESIQSVLADVYYFWSKFPVKYNHFLRTVNSTGERIFDSKNIKNCYSVTGGENLRYCQDLQSKTSNSYDYTVWGVGSDNIYECVTCGLGCYNLKFCLNCWEEARNLEYCVYSIGSSDCFGCVGLYKKKYCIFNKQYNKDEYFVLRDKIINQMKEVPYVDSEGRKYFYGEFFPYEISPIAYNESMAQDFFPLDSNLANKNGFIWRDINEREYKTTLDAKDLSDNINDVGDEIIKEIIKCEDCGKAYKIIEKEFQFYKRIPLPLPHLCHYCRFTKRFKLVNSPILWNRTCMCNKKHNNHEGHCGVEFETSYSPDRPEIVYCEKCYQQEVY